MQDRYQRARQFLPARMATLVRNTDIVPFWNPDGESFWYRRDTAQGHDYMLVDARTGDQRPAFDHAAVARGLQEVTGQDHDPARLPFRLIGFDGPVVTLSGNTRAWAFDTTTQKLRSLSHAAARDEVVSPDGRLVAFVRDDNIWVRSTETGEERAITTDGKPGLSYGKSPDCNTAMLSNRIAGVRLQAAVVWSPESGRLVTHQLDETQVPELFYLQSVPPKGTRPVLHSLRMPFPGEAIPTQRLVIVDVSSGEQTWIDTPPMAASQITAIECLSVWWNDDGESLFLIDIERASKAARLFRVDAATGQTRLIIEETAETFIELNHGAVHDRPLVRTIDNGREVIWFSQRDGWGHLYLYDGATGALKHRITGGDFLVRAIHHVDPTGREVTFSANGPDVSDMPYDRDLFRINLDGSGLRKLTPGDADHQVVALGPIRTRDFRDPGTQPPSEGVSPDGRYFVATASRLDMPPVTTLYRADGSAVATIATADIDGARALGWKPPEAFSVLAADGETRIYGAIWYPSDFDPARKYPLLDHSYPGPQRNVTPQRCFARAERSAYCQSQALAELGMIVVTIDGRGTPFRSKAFHDAAYLTQDNPGSLDDHVAAIRQLAKDRPWIDLDRVGITGHSGGAYASAMAILKYPDVFKVAVCSSGNYDFMAGYFYWGEKYMGVPAPQADGHSQYKALNCGQHAANLKGKLLLAHGDMDDNVHHAVSAQFINALIAANKDFNWITVPNANHESLPGHPYWMRRKMDFLVRHLIQTEPPQEFRL